MGSKAIVSLGLFLAIVLLITSDVTAKDLAAETSTSTEQTNGVEDAKYGAAGYDGGHGHGGGYEGGRGGGYEGGHGGRGGGHEGGRGGRGGGGY
ncbi:dormancy-associated protein 2-like [Rhododendron vialii]|uniref:dormancy-associated protein 2-like n=1 Tax=Rhododendron vialii TaxID=182163 RepID=UPI00265D8F10|nr:dormancy-associated protein 2-like [Rhododendron vialii]